jgi:hypothetical protein
MEENGGDKKWAFRLIWYHSARQVILAAQSAEEYSDWLFQLKNMNVNWVLT